MSRRCAFPGRRGCPSAAAPQNRRVAAREEAAGLRLRGDADSCRDFKAGEIDFLCGLAVRVAPRFEIQLDRFLQILLSGDERLALRGHGKIQAARNEPRAVILEHCMDGSHGAKVP